MVAHIKRMVSQAHGPRAFVVSYLVSLPQETGSPVDSTTTDQLVGRKLPNPICTLHASKSCYVSTVFFSFFYFAREVDCQGIIWQIHHHSLWHPIPLYWRAADPSCCSTVSLPPAPSKQLSAKCDHKEGNTPSKSSTSTTMSTPSSKVFGPESWQTTETQGTVFGSQEDCIIRL